MVSQPTRSCRGRPASRGLSLIEIMVVMSVLVVLMGLLLAGLKGIRASAQSAKTGTILATARQGLLLTAAERGGLPQPAEHPLAASRAPRPAFLRAAGGPVGSDGVAIRGVAPDAVPPGDAQRVLLDDDRCDLRDAPLVFGARRDVLGVLGASQAAVTQYEQRSLMPGQRMVSSGFLVETSGSAEDNHDTLRTFLGGSAYEELLGLGAIRNSLDPAEEPSRLFADKRLSERTGPGVRAAKWQPGFMRSGGWIRYDLPGVALYDSFGNEVFYRIDGRSVSLISAGADSALAIDPGQDRSYHAETTALGTFAGDDRDGSTDNVVLGVEHD
jgi:prepilin-type N-terminal cleavage/methylation domain-containing protein